MFASSRVLTRVRAALVHTRTTALQQHTRCFSTAPADNLLQHLSLARLAHKSKLQVHVSDRARTIVEVVPVLAASEFALNAFSTSTSSPVAATDLFDVVQDVQPDGSVASVRITKRTTDDAIDTKLQLLVPHVLDVSIQVARGDVTLTDKLEGDVAVVVGDGAIHVDKLRGPSISLKTSHGRLTIASLVEGEHVQLAASAVDCKRLMAGAAVVKLVAASSSTDASSSNIGAIYSSACSIQSLARTNNSLTVGSVHGYLRITGDSFASVDVDSVNGALELEDTGSHCHATVHFDAWPPATRSSIVVGRDVVVSVEPTAALRVELHGRNVTTDGCTFETSAFEQLDHDYAVFTGSLEPVAEGSQNKKSDKQTSGKIDGPSAKLAAMRTSFFASSDRDSNEREDGDDDDAPQLLVHATGGSVRFEQLDWMAKLKRKHLHQ